MTFWLSAGWIMVRNGWSYQVKKRPGFCACGWSALWWQWAPVLEGRGLASSHAGLPWSPGKGFSPGTCPLERHCAPLPFSLTFSLTPWKGFLCFLLNQGRDGPEAVPQFFLAREAAEFWSTQPCTEVLGSRVGAERAPGSEHAARLSPGWNRREGWAGRSRSD